MPLVRIPTRGVGSDTTGRLRVNLLVNILQLFRIVSRVPLLSFNVKIYYQILINLSVAYSAIYFYSQLAILRWQVCVSRGKSARSMAHASVSDILQ